MAKKIITAILVISVAITSFMVFGVVASADEVVEAPIVYATPSERLVITEADSGYYADTRTSDPVSGEVVFDAYVDAAAFEGITHFGVYIYNAASGETAKVELQSGDLTSLATYNGYYNASVYNIAPKHFEDTIIAIPYVVVNGNIEMGAAYEARVDDGDYIKWLGPKK